MIRKLAVASVILVFLSASAILASLCIGGTSYSPSDIFGIMFSDDSGILKDILFGIRLPRILLSFIVGASLSASGAAFQALLRNPLADPYIVGTSSGAALGASLAIVLALPAAGFLSPSVLFAFAGAGIVMLFVYFVSLKGGRISVGTFLLAGVIAGSFCGALVSFIMTFAGNALPHIVWWLMGGFAGREGWDYVMLVLPYFVIGSASVFALSGDLNLLSMGEEIASSRGVSVERSKFIIIAAASLLTAASVSAAGTIGFVGFMIPHLMRRIFGSDHRILIVASVLGGGTFLLLADTLARTVMPGGAEIPVGIITSLCGAPFFFIALRKSNS